jgi:hypothetical protein
MIEDDDNLADLERSMRAKLEAMQAKPTAEDAQEKAMVAKLLGTKTQAEQFFRHETRKHDSPKLDLRRPRTFKPRPPLIRFEYWEGCIGIRWQWHIERFEDGKRVSEETGDDWQKRDARLIHYQAAGYQCRPVEVAGNVPEPIKGRFREQRKKPSGRFDIMSRISTVTSDDVARFHPDDVYEEYDR